MRKILGMLALLSMVSCGFIFQPLDTINKGKDMSYEVTKEIMTGKNAIHNYEWFKQQEADIKRLGEQVDSAIQSFNDYKSMLPKERSAWDYMDKQELMRLRSNVTGLEQMLQQAIGDYNAKSSMASRNVFKDNLPSNIQRAMYVSKEMIVQ